MSSELRQKNIAAFEAYYPAIYTELVTYSSPTTVVELPDGDYNIDFHGSRFYAGGAKATVDRQFDNFLAHATRFVVHPPTSGALDHVSANYLNRILRRGIDKGIMFTTEPQTHDSYHMVVLGVGLGFHVPRLMEMCKSVTLCVADINIDGLYHSLDYVDWTPFLERRGKNPKVFTILIHSDREFLLHRIRHHCRYSNPAAVDGMYVFRHYPNSVLEQTLAALSIDAHLINTGLGFFQDEMEMVRASYHNLQDGDFHLYTRTPSLTDVPVFVVGSGPSIDDEIEYLRENQDKAIILSCGTALRVLLKQGIKPDFQIMIENGETSFELIASLRQAFDMSGIPLLGSTTVTTGLKDLFDEAVFFFRRSLASYPMFCPDKVHSVDEVGPTVTNCGLSVALELGFRNIYLFGVDLGSRSPARHHSSHSSYHQADRDVADGGDLIMEFEGNLQKVVPGNFGGVVFTDNNFCWSRDSMERNIRAYKQRNVHNCSDGIIIGSTAALDSSSIVYKTTAEDKVQRLAFLKQHFPKIDKNEDFLKIYRDADWRKRFGDFLDGIIAFIDSPAEEPFGCFAKLANHLINDAARLPMAEEHMFRGSIFLTMITGDYYWKRIPDPEVRAWFHDMMMEEFRAAMVRLKAQAERFADLLPEAKSQDIILNSLREMELAS